ncbi:MAG: uridine kinase [Bacteroidetes bacterium]|nr:uridine kinase [Bacteroidota bacterium]
MHHGTYLVGVAGGSGSGKTTLVRALRNQLPPGSVSLVSLDDYYLPLDRQQRDANGKVNFDLPGAFDMALLYEDLQSLTQGEPVYRQEYHYEMDTEPRWMEIRPAPVVLVEGLFLLQDEALRNLFDLKVYVEACEDVQLQRRIARDGRERSYSKEQVLYQWENHVMPAYREHLLPYRKHCDIHVVNESRFERGLHVLRDHLAQHAGVAVPLGESL